MTSGKLDKNFNTRFISFFVAIMHLRINEKHPVKWFILKITAKYLKKIFFSKACKLLGLTIAI
jgi:hypothetical protein